MPNFERKRSGGPSTSAGKRRSARNAVKTGVAVDYWLEPAEQDEYDARVTALTAEYAPVSATVQMLIERLASLMRGRLAGPCSVHPGARRPAWPGRLPSQPGAAIFRDRAVAKWASRESMDAAGTPPWRFCNERTELKK